MGTANNTEYIWSGIKKTFTFWVNGIERIRGFGWDAPLGGGVSEVLWVRNPEWWEGPASRCRVGWTSSHSGGTQGVKALGQFLECRVRACLLLKPSHRLLPFLKAATVWSMLFPPLVCLIPPSTFKSQFWYIPTPQKSTNFLLHDLACNLSHMFRKHSLFNTYHAFSVIIYIFLWL